MLTTSREMSDEENISLVEQFMRDEELARQMQENINQEWEAQEREDLRLAKQIRRREQKLDAFEPLSVQTRGKYFSPPPAPELFLCT